MSPGENDPESYGPPGTGPSRGEKEDEKEREKRQEKGGGLDEKYRRNPVGFAAWALVIIWLGITLLLRNIDVIDDSDQGWALFFWGGGAIFIIEALVRLLVPRWRRPIVGSFVWGAIWVGIGFGLWYGRWAAIGPIVIIAVGVGILAGRLIPRR